MLRRTAVPADQGRPAGADDRDRGRDQRVPQAGHVGRPLAFGYRVPVGAEGGVGVGGRQREPEVVHVAVQGAVHRKPRVGEPPQHEPVLGQRLRGEDTDPPATGHRDHMLQQQHADAALVHVIGDRHGDLRGPGVLIATLKGAAADHFAVQEGQQRRVVRRGLPADPAGFLLGRERCWRRRTIGSTWRRPRQHGALPG